MTVETAIAPAATTPPDGARRRRGARARARARGARDRGRGDHRARRAARRAFVAAVELILDCRGRVVVTGIGKSGHIARKLAATLASTGTPAFFVHPAEAATATSA